MADAIALERGRPPWLPAEGATLLAKFDWYDGMPLAGVVGLGDAKYLFHCVGGEADRLNVWVYAPVSDRQMADLDSAEARGDEFEDKLRHVVMSHGSCAAALAVDGQGIVEWEPVEELDTAEIIINGMLERLVASTQQLEQEARSQRDHFASAAS